MISGALIVAVAQLAVVRKGEAPAQLEAAGDQARLAAAALVVDAGANLTESEPEPSVVSAASESTVDASRTKATRVERLDATAEAGKDDLDVPEHVGGARQRLALARPAGKATNVDVRPELEKGTSFGDGEHTVQAPLTSIHPIFKAQTGTVQAAFEGAEARTAGEELSWDVHNVFQNDGPRPFFYVDENTGTLMFGLGWQH